MKSFVVEDELLQGMYWVRDAGACSGVYVIEEGRTLIDAGNMFGLLDELQDLHPMDRLERILITHSHFDHIGGIGEIYQAIAPDIYIHPISREYLKLLRPPFPEFFDALEKAGKIKLIKDGDTIKGGPDLLAIHTPGHTAGDVSFFHSASGALFCGDTVLPYQYELAAALSKPDEVCGGRMQDRLESLRSLLKLPVRHLFPGHGDPVVHKGGDHIKLALYSLYERLHESDPEQPWILLGQDMLDAGLIDDARLCAAKASEIAPDSEEVRELMKRTGDG